MRITVIRLTRLCTALRTQAHGFAGDSVDACIRLATPYRSAPLLVRCSTHRSSPSIARTSTATRRPRATHHTRNARKGPARRSTPGGGPRGAAVRAHTYDARHRFPGPPSFSSLAGGPERSSAFGGRGPALRGLVCRGEDPAGSCVSASRGPDVEQAQLWQARSEISMISDHRWFSAQISSGGSASPGRVDPQGLHGLALMQLRARPGKSAPAGVAASLRGAPRC